MCKTRKPEESGAWDRLGPRTSAARRTQHRVGQTNLSRFVGRKMKYGVATMLLFSLVAIAKAQDTRGSAQDASSIGLRIGEKAPTFRARDQFDHDQSNGTLKGSKGTVLLFFRSADW